jgi:guanyl-specific ribonuclease Sa
MSQSPRWIRPKSNPWLRRGVVVVVFALAAYSSWQRRNVPPPRVDQPATVEPAKTVQRPSSGSAKPTTVAQQTIRNQDGVVVARGDIDVGPTLDRIERGERLAFSHDGTTFQNRERRLPQKASGYYQEYVHPTPGVSGPGPQRIIVGRGGEIYYTPDHYRTFQRLDQR